MYVYDEDKFSTRINFTEKLSSNNAPDGWTGVQVEIYFSKHRPLSTSPSEVSPAVREKFVEMGLIEEKAVQQGQVNLHTYYSPWANVIFDHGTRPALQKIWACLETQGLGRDADDIHPLTDWEKSRTVGKGSIFMAGRFGQWKYYWTDDCVLRGQQLNEASV